MASSERSTKSAPTGSAPKDPQPSVDRIDELARRVLSGDIILPKFQRDFVWERSQVLKLLDSIMKNYPIGSILLWQSREELRRETTIADLQIALPKPDYPVNYLLDGQQRLSTVCGAIHWTGSNPESIWNLAYDLRRRNFLHLDSLDEPPLHQIRTNKLEDAAAFFQHVGTLSACNMTDAVGLAEEAKRLFNRFKDYKIATVTLGEMAIDDVAPIFERVNSTGTRLTIVDLMRAATWSEDFDLVDSIDQVLETLAEKGFGGIDRKVILRNISAAAGGGFAVASIDGLRKLEPTALQQAVASAEAAYARAVDFLSTEIRLPSDKLIPYNNQFAVLGELFRLVPAPSAEQFTRAKAWFWRTAISGYFSGWNTGNMATDLDAIQRFASGTARDLETPARQPHATIWANRTFRANGAHAKVLAMMLAYHQPRDLLTGQAIDVGKALSWNNSKEYHHFFPKNFLQQRGEPSSRYNALPNFVMLTSVSNKFIADRAPSDYLIDVEEAAGDALPEWLASNLIPMNAFEAAKQNDYDAFLEHRSTYLHAAAFRLADWTASS